MVITEQMINTLAMYYTTLHIIKSLDRSSYSGPSSSGDCMVLVLWCCGSWTSSRNERSERHCLCSAGHSFSVSCRRIPAVHSKFHFSLRDRTVCRDHEVGLHFANLRILFPAI